MRSISELSHCATQHLTEYTSARNNFAFLTYDRVGQARIFEPTDALAPGLLDASVRGRYVIEMFRAGNVEDNPYASLMTAITEVLQSEACNGAEFLDIDLETDPAWQLVRRAFVSSETTPGIKVSKVSKMLHRKIPNLVPIYDSKVRGFYGTASSSPGSYWKRIQEDWRLNRDFLNELAGKVDTPDGRKLSLLRAADVVIWTHVKTNCSERA